MPVTSPSDPVGYLFYKQPAPPRPDLKGSGGILRVSVVGGADFQLQVGVFDANDHALQGAGIPVNGIPVPAEQPVNGQVVWPFDQNSDASYIQWGLVPIRSATGHYVVTITVSDPGGNVQAITHFIGDVTAGQTYDTPSTIYDMVSFA
jgi:hypothetical protein